MVIGLTGGIATGKTTFREMLRELLPSATFFDADQAARDLTTTDEEVRKEIRQEFGPEVFSETGELNRAALRTIVFASAARKAALETILHPRIRQMWRSQSEPLRRSPEIFVADIPLLYETNAETLCDRVAVVACTREIQLARLMERASHSPADIASGRPPSQTLLARATAEKMIDSQMQMSAKIARSEYVAWNNGHRSVLAAQAAILAESWRR